jgi:hypothetical protein
MKIYVLYRIDLDGDSEEWQVFDGAYSTREKAEAALKVKQEASKSSWNYQKEYEIEEEILDEE